MMTDDRKDAILTQLKVIIDPDLGKDIVTLGFVQDLVIGDDGAVSFRLNLTTPACPVKDLFVAEAKKRVGELPWVTSVSVQLSATSAKSALLDPAANGLANVTNIIAVSSCKGGVGKSTIAVNLAFNLAQKGAKVGLFDADIYGPSLPTMVHIEDTQLFYQGSMIKPLELDGVKLMSFGYTQTGTDGGPAILRGPIVSQIIKQLLCQTQWGELDYLILDLPPGTGDIQLTLSQIIPITAAVIVTTPQYISFVDVVKGIQMFDTLKVPTIAVIENMSYFICDDCDKQHFIYGHGAKDRLIRQFGIQNSFSLPIQKDITLNCDKGTPAVLASKTFSDLFSPITDAIVREISKMRYQTTSLPELRHSEFEGIVMKVGDIYYSISPADLRLSCQCARCVDEWTGAPLLKTEDIAPDIVPLQLKPVGSYAIGINWSDGHSSLYPYEQLLSQMLPV